MRFFLIILSFLATSVAAHDYKLDGISVDHPASYPTTGRTGAGYMMITNTGAADRLIAVEADFPRVLMHETTMKDGIASMGMVMDVDIPSDGMAHFQPGGLHVMFMGLSKHLMVGDEIPATLVFETAGRLDVVFKVGAEGLAVPSTQSRQNFSHVVDGELIGQMHEPLIRINVEDGL